jgi:Uncharacterised nucleotidyltransferase
VPELSAQAVFALMAARGAAPAYRESPGGGDSPERGRILEIAASEQHKLGATLLSLWERDGVELDAPAQAKLAAYRERRDRYQGIWDQVSKIAEDAYLLKGATLAALYPPGVLRSAGDLDIVCPSVDGLWAIATYLVGEGWELAAFTVLCARPGDGIPQHVMVELIRPGPPELGEELAVGLTTVEIITRTSQPPHQLARPLRSPLAASAVALVAERWERELRSRDLLDLALLSERMTEPDIAELRDGLARTGLWPEWNALAAAVAQQGWQCVHLPEAEGAARRERVRRVGRAVVRGLRPVRLLALVAQEGVDRDTGRIGDLLADLAHRIGVLRVLALGLPLFGVPVTAADGPAPSALELVRAGQQVLARTPVGTFLLTAGSCREEWLEEVAG